MSASHIKLTAIISSLFIFAGCNTQAKGNVDTGGSKPVAFKNIPAGSILFNLSLKNTDQENNKINYPITFGHPFIKDDMNETKSLKLIGEDKTSIPIQVDVKATHDDGSYRHAVLSFIAPSLAANSIQQFSIIVEESAPTGLASLTQEDLLVTG